MDNITYGPTELNINKKIYFKIVLLNTFFLGIFYFLMIAFKHYGVDDYIIAKGLWRLPRTALQTGRYTFWIFGKVLEYFNINVLTSQCLFGFIMIVICSFSITAVALRIIRECNLQNVRRAILIDMGLLLFFANVFFQELFVFVFSYGQWMLGVVGAVVGAIYITQKGWKNKVIGWIGIATVYNSYQVMIAYYVIFVMLFLYLHFRENVNVWKLIWNSFLNAIPVFVVAIINYIITKIILMKGDLSSVSYYNEFEIGLEKLVSYINNQKNIWIDGLGLLPKGMLIGVFFLLLLIMLIIWKNSGLKHSHLIYIGLIYFATYFVLSLVMIAFSAVYPRTISPVFGLLGLTVIMIGIWGDLGNRCKWELPVTSAIVSAVLLFNFYCVQKISIGMYQNNALEKDYALKIKYEIDNYECETGNKIKYICFYRDSKRTYWYNEIYGLELYGVDQISRNAFSADWGVVHCLNFYGGMDLIQGEKNQTLDDYFAKQNWDEFDPDSQIVFDSETMHIVIY